MALVIGARVVIKKHVAAQIGIERDAIIDRIPSGNDWYGLRVRYLRKKQQSTKMAFRLHEFDIIEHNGADAQPDPGRDSQSQQNGGG